MQMESIFFYGSAAPKFQVLFSSLFRAKAV